jgi:hypothetical protein
MENRHGQMSEKMEAVLFQLRQVTRERDELRKRLALSSPGTTFDDCRYSRTLGRDRTAVDIAVTLLYTGDSQTVGCPPRGVGSTILLDAFSVCFCCASDYFVPNRN